MTTQRNCQYRYFVEQLPDAIVATIYHEKNSHYFSLLWGILLCLSAKKCCNAGCKCGGKRYPARRKL